MRRSMMGMSQGQLGKAINLTFQQIQKYESGKNQITAARLLELADILQVPITYFYEDMEMAAPAVHGGFSDNPQQPLEDTTPGENELLHRRETLKLIRAYYKMSDAKQRRKFYELLKTMAE